MGTRRLWIVIVAVLAALGLCWFFLMPSGRKTVEAIDDTATEVTGKRAVDQGQPLRREVDDISAQQKDRLRGMRLDTGTENSR